MKKQACLNIVFAGCWLVAMLMQGCGGEKKKPAPVNDTLEKPVVKKAEPLVIPPFNLPAGLNTYKVDVDSGRVFTVAPYGTRVEVPAKAFVDSAGNLLSGKVTLTYREMHTMNDILISGVPLNYDAAGMLKRLRSGGMFELRAAQEGRQVFLDSGKVISVSMACFDDDARYHAFYLDEEKARDWEYLKDLDGAANPEKKKIMKRARQKVNELQLPLDGYFAFNYMALLDVYLDNKEAEIKKKRTDVTLQGKIKEYGVAWSNIYCYQSVEFNGTKTLASLLLWKKLNKEPWPSWAQQATCDLKPNGDGNYTLELTVPKGKVNYKATIQPFFPIKSLLAFSPSYWRNKYDLALRKAVEEEMRKQKVADVYQTLEAHRFGFYNIDKLQREADYVQVRVEPEFDREVGAVNDIAIYYISEQYRTVVKYPKEEWGNVTLLPDSEGKLFTVLPGNKLAVAGEQVLRKLHYREIKANGGAVVKLKFVTVNASLNSASEIAKALGIQEFPM
ncbi:MAG TPA: hypothetical protein VD905_21465 [Flavobacteriales bacterium]|nr:hypothetical protein [Flavobacteriales bacterium]